MFKNNAKKIRYPEDGERCRLLLQNILPVSSEKDGTYLKAILFLFSPFLLIAVIMYVLMEFVLPHFLVYILIPMPLLLIYAGGIFSSFELIAIGYKYQNLFYKYISPYLIADEKCLAFAYGGMLEPSPWSENYSDLAYFIFTTDRLILLLTERNIKGFKQTNKIIKKNGIDAIVTKIFVCDLRDNQSVKLGGLMIPPHLHIFSKLLTVVPIDEKTRGKFSINVRRTRNGDVINKIFKQLKKAQIKSVSH